MKLTKVKKVYVGKDGKQHQATNFYLVVDNGKKICIKNVFKNDYTLLSFLAEEVKD